MPEQDYATKQDIQELKLDLKQDVRALHERMDHVQDHLVEVMRDMQTEVLRAFQNRASPMDVRVRGHEERLTLMEERLRHIEHGLPSKQ